MQLLMQLNYEQNTRFSTPSIESLYTLSQIYYCIKKISQLLKQNFKSSKETFFNKLIDFKCGFFKALTKFNLLIFCGYSLIV